MGDTVYIQSKDTALLKTASATASTLTKLQPGTEVVWQGTDATNKQFHKVKAGAKEGFVLQSNIKPNKPLVEVASDGKPTTMSALASSGALAACRTGSVTGLCNTYIAGSISTNSANYGCNYTSPDRFWCPAGRKVAVSDPPDYIGVYIETRHTGVTGVIGMTRDFSDEFVMRLEPVRA